MCVLAFAMLWDALICIFLPFHARRGLYFQMAPSSCSFMALRSVSAVVDLPFEQGRHHAGQQQPASCGAWRRPAAAAVGRGRLAGAYEPTCATAGTEGSSLEIH